MSLVEHALSPYKRHLIDGKKIHKNYKQLKKIFDKHYYVYQQMEDMIDVLLQTERSKHSKLKLVK